MSSHGTAGTALRGAALSGSRTALGTDRVGERSSGHESPLKRAWRARRVFVPKAVFWATRLVWVLTGLGWRPDIEIPTPAGEVGVTTGIRFATPSSPESY